MHSAHCFCLIVGRVCCRDMAPKVLQHVQHVVFDQEDCERFEQFEEGWLSFVKENDLPIGNDVARKREIQYSLYKDLDFQN